MGWFLELEAPVQTALITLPTALLGAIGGIIILFLKNPQPQRTSSHLAVAGALVDNKAVDELRSSVDGLIGEMKESTKWRERETRAIEQLTKELAEGRTELRLQSRMDLLNRS